MSRVRTLAARLARGHTRLAVRLFLFNALLVFLPVAGLWYLDAYEQHLLEQQERGMVQQARLFAAALAEVPGFGTAPDGPIAQRLLDRLGQTSDVRLRVVVPDGRIAADSHRIPGPEGREDPYGASTPETRASRARWTYRAGAWLGRRWRALWLAEARPTSAETIVVGPGRIHAPEVDRAFTGGYGAATRLSPGGQRSVTLYGAVPVAAEGRVPAVVLVSQSTFRILQRLYDVRLRMFQVVVVSLAVAFLFTAVGSFTIVRPLRQLRDDAEALVDHHGRRLRAFRGTKGTDEIGELARALEELTNRVDAHLRFTERFAADVSHELRNPLASIRASAETLAVAERAEDRARFHARIATDIARLETLIAGVREVTRVDAGLEAEERRPIDLVGLVRERAGDGTGVVLAVEADAPIAVEASADRLGQVLDNLLDNARSFSPSGVPVEVDVRRAGDDAIVRVRDHGPGIPADHLEHIFDRFFSHRPGQVDARQKHAGLGLSIARAIAERHGGTLDAASHPGGGAVFELTLPLVRS
jgi:two-component system, OmpR family, sensor histidine kinase ChvG